MNSVSWKIEYAEANEQFRQIDTRIWAIYGIYVVVVGAGFQSAIELWTDADGEPSRLLITSILAGISVVTVAMMALVGHLQWYSDLLADCGKDIERTQGLDVHLRLELPDEVAARLWGPHRWLMGLRARDVMQTLGILVIAACCVASLFLLQTSGRNVEMDDATVICVAKMGLVTLSLLGLMATGVAVKKSCDRVKIERQRTQQAEERRKEAEAKRGADT